MSHFIAERATIVHLPDGRTGTYLQGDDSNVSPRTLNPAFYYLAESEGISRALMLCDQVLRRIGFSRELANVQSVPLADLPESAQAFITRRIPELDVATAVQAREMAHRFDAEYTHAPQELAHLHHLVDALLAGEIRWVPTRDDGSGSQFYGMFLPYPRHEGLAHLRA